jgi:hypothetical protein
MRDGVSVKDIIRETSGGGDQQANVAILERLQPERFYLTCQLTASFFKKVENLAL